MMNMWLAPASAGVPLGTVGLGTVFGDVTGIFFLGVIAACVGVLLWQARRLAKGSAGPEGTRRGHLTVVPRPARSVG